MRPLWPEWWTWRRSNRPSETLLAKTLLSGPHWIRRRQSVLTAYAATMTSVPKWDRQLSLVCVDHEYGKELGRLRLAGVSADAMPVARQFREALSRLVCGHRSVVDLTADRSLQHGRVDEGGFGVRVAGRVAARAVFNEDALDALAGDVWQFVLVNECHLGILLFRFVPESAADRQTGEKQRIKNTFHVALSFGWPVADQAATAALVIKLVLTRRCGWPAPVTARPG